MKLVLFLRATTVVALLLPAAAHAALALNIGLAGCPQLGTTVATLAEAFALAEANPGTTLYTGRSADIQTGGVLDSAQDFEWVGGIDGASCNVQSATEIDTSSPGYSTIEIKGGSARFKNLRFVKHTPGRGEAMSLHVRGAEVELDLVFFIALQRNLDGPDSALFGGGAMNVSSLAQTPARVRLVNTRFEGNSTNGSGGAIFCNGGAANTAPTTITLASTDVVLNRFVGNAAARHGGAIYLFQTCSLETEGPDLRFEGNEAANGRGGAIAFSSHQDTSPAVAPRTARIANALFRANVASESGGAIGGFGKGSIEVERSTFDRNEAGGRGGAISVISMPLEVASTRFTNNRAAAGGAIAMVNDLALSPQGVVATITGRCDSRSREADQYCAEFVQNHANDGGGAIVGLGYGLNLRGYVFARNTAGNLGTIIAHETRPTANADLRKVRIENTLFEPHGGGPLIFYPSDATTDLTLRHVTAAPPSDRPDAVLIGFGQQVPTVTLYANVLPANALAGEACNVAYQDAMLVATARGNHRPAPQSPVVDAACATETVERDLDGRLRTAPADIGAFELFPGTPVPPDPIIFLSSFE